jgi:hypothetical protein
LRERIISLTRFQESFGLRFFLSLITLVLFVIMALVSLQIVISLTRGIGLQSGIPGQSTPFLQTSTVTPITESQQRKAGEEPSAPKGSNTVVSGMNFPYV